jgi:dTDP-4-dehydrorhamnose reductase
MEDNRMNPVRKRIVIIGSAGRLGAYLADSLEAGHSVIRLARQQLDLASPVSIRNALEPLEYDMAIICGALTAVDYCETHPEEAAAINAEGPGEIARISAEKGAHVTFISTDMVHDGAKNGAYSETDAPHPISVYGASKLEGERLVTEASPSNLVARVSWLFGPGKAAFPEWIIGQACAKAEVTLPGDKIACPTSCVDLTKMLAALLFPENGHPASGVFNLCNPEPCSWRDWGQFCIDTARAAGLPVLAGGITGVPVDSVPAFIARRPVNSALAMEKFTRTTDIRPRPWQEAVEEFLRDSALFQQHRESAAAV